MLTSFSKNSHFLPQNFSFFLSSAFTAIRLNVGIDRSVKIQFQVEVFIWMENILIRWLHLIRRLIDIWFVLHCFQFPEEWSTVKMQ
jgi:hypothetical protein